MPAGQDADGEVQSHHAVHRDDQRRGQAREQQVGRLVAVPVARGPPPAQRQDAIGPLDERVRGAVAQGGEVGDEPHVPEEQRHREIRGDGEDVLHQRAPELGLEAHGAGVREEPVEKPGAPQVYEREEARARDGEQGHGLGEAVAGGAPLLVQE